MIAVSFKNYLKILKKNPAKSKAEIVYKPAYIL